MKKSFGIKSRYILSKNIFKAVQLIISKLYKFGAVWSKALELYIFKAVQLIDLKLYNQYLWSYYETIWSKENKNEKNHKIVNWQKQSILAIFLSAKIAQKQYNI